MLIVSFPQLHCISWIYLFLYIYIYIFVVILSKMTREIQEFESCMEKMDIKKTCLWKDL